MLIIQFHLVKSSSKAVNLLIGDPEGVLPHYAGPYFTVID
jgi:hypothetical protein